MRVRATDRKNRIGSLLMNPGGPGAPGTEFARDFASILPDEITKRFDIVGFDPRGSGETSPVKCEDNLDGVFSADYSPDTPAERADLDTELQQLAQSCEARSGDLLPYVSSESTVRDMDRIRQAVGDKKLTYVGYSYGTYLGTLYAKLFPKKVRALVLDGAIDPNLSALRDRCRSGRRLRAFARRVPRATARRTGAARSTTRAIRLAPSISSRPRSMRSRWLPATVGRWAGASSTSASRSPVFGPGGIPAAGAGAGRRGCAVTEHAFSSSRTSTRVVTTTAPTTPRSLRSGPSAAGTGRRWAGRTRTRRRSRSSARPRPVRRPAPQRRARLRVLAGAPGEERGADPGRRHAPILVIGTTNDPATPLKWAQGLAGELSSGVLLTAEGTQHTSFAIRRQHLRRRQGDEVPRRPPATAERHEVRLISPERATARI